MDIIDLFDPWRGDLLYGFAEDRGDYLDHMEKLVALGRNPGLKKFLESWGSFWIQVDAYNDTLFGDQTLFATAASDVGNSGDQKNQSLNDPYITAFWQKLKQHRFSPLEVFTTPDDKIKKEGWSPELDKDRYYLAIRRACKFGIENVLNAASPDARIHFVLDLFSRVCGERMVQATYKLEIAARSRTAVPITTSEIRYVYRNWHRLKDRVVFYYGFASEVAPWEDDTRKAAWVGSDGNPYVYTFRNLWGLYGGSRSDKYTEMLEKAKHDRPVTYIKNKVAVDKLITDAGQLDANSRCAKLEQALAILEPDKAKWKAFQN